MKVRELRALLDGLPEDMTVAVLDGFDDVMPLRIGVLPADRWVDNYAGSRPSEILVVTADNDDREYGEASKDARAYIEFLPRRV